MKKNILYIVTLLFIFVSCDNNPCIISIYSSEEKKGFELPKVYWIKFYPSKARIGDTVLVMYEKEINNLDYDKDFEITDNGKIKYIGTDISPYSSVFPLDENSRFLDNVLYICPQKQFDNVLRHNYCTLYFAHKPHKTRNKTKLQGFNFVQLFGMISKP